MIVIIGSLEPAPAIKLAELSKYYAITAINPCGNVRYYLAGKARMIKIGDRLRDVKAYLLDVRDERVEALRGRYPRRWAEYVGDDSPTPRLDSTRFLNFMNAISDDRRDLVVSESIGLAFIAWTSIGLKALKPAALGDLLEAETAR